MDIKGLYTVLAIVNHGNFVDAARKLQLSQSGVSLQIRSLEEELGILLFDRSRRPPVLTESGRTFVEHAREVVQVWETLSDRLRSDVTSGVLRIGAVHTIVSGFLPEALRCLGQRHPDLNIRLVTGLTHELEGHLRRGSLDAVIGSEPEDLSNGLVFRLVCEEPLAVIAHKSAKGKTDRDILRNNPYVRFNPKALVSRIVERELARRRIAITSHMEVDTLEGVFSLVANQLGVSIVPVPTGTPHFAPDVRLIPFGKPNVTRRLGLLQPAGNSRAHLADPLFEELVAAARRAPPAMPGRRRRRAKPSPLDGKAEPVA
jgi:DNA-binding transcriptional LysR family regulator